jgi:hypothetical protein
VWCVADGCGQQVNKSGVLCRKHWRLVPKHLQDAVEEGEVDGLVRAIRAVALREGRR